MQASLIVFEGNGKEGGGKERKRGGEMAEAERSIFAVFAVFLA